MRAGDDGQPYLILIPAFTPCSLGKSFSMAWPALLFLESAVGTLDQRHLGGSTGLLLSRAWLGSGMSLVPAHLAFLQFTGFPQRISHLQQDAIGSGPQNAYNQLVLMGTPRLLFKQWAARGRRKASGPAQEALQGT